MATVGAIFVLLWTKVSGTPWRDIGYVRPASWPRSLAAGIAIGAALKVLMKAVVMPLLGADPINHAYRFLAGNTMLLPAAIVAMCIVAFGEETVFRGFLFERLEKWLGSGLPARIATVLITTLLFAAAHYHDQGIAGTEQAAITGLVFGTMFALRRSIVPVVAAHAAFDLTALAIIYAGAESAVAHLLFR